MQMLHDLIMDMNLPEFCMVQSFDHEALSEFEKINKGYIESRNDSVIETSSCYSKTSQFTQHPLNVATLYL